MDAGVCIACGERAVVVDAISGIVACESCGRLNEDGPNLVSGQAAQFTEGSGWQNSYAPHGHLHSYDPTQWTEKKKRLAMQQVHHVTSVLRLPPDKVDEVKHLLSLFFEDRWGVGRWVEILVGACVYIVIRQSHTPLTLLEVAEAVNCGPPELGRMFNRVLNTLQIKLPETKPSIFLERAFMSLPAFETLTKALKRDMVKHGVLLLEYAQQWSITTGRHFLPVVAAIILMLGEVNQVKVAAVQISRELHTSQACTSLRSRELKHALIGFAQKLPWGKDISVKTLHRHMPFLLQYLDMSRRLKGTQKEVDTAEKNRGLSSLGVLQDGSREKKRCFDSEPGTPPDDSNKAQKSEACDAPGQQAVWTGLPPSFVTSQVARQRRSKKIKSAKARILGTKQAFFCDTLDKSSTRKEVLDNEDLLIEYLVLKGANEDAIQDGYYRALLSASPIEDGKSFSDEELARYFRSKGEVAFLKSLSDPEPEGWQSCPSGEPPSSSPQEI